MSYTANQRAQDKVTRETLRRIFEEQRGRCVLTGFELTAENVSLDHIQPVSKGGTNDRSNLRLVTKHANRARHAMTDAEFVELCEKLVAHAERKQGSASKAP